MREGGLEVGKGAATVAGVYAQGLAEEFFDEGFVRFVSREIEALE